MSLHSQPHRTVGEIAQHHTDYYHVVQVIYVKDSYPFFDHNSNYYQIITDKMNRPNHHEWVDEWLGGWYHPQTLRCHLLLTPSLSPSTTVGSFDSIRFASIRFNHSCLPQFGTVGFDAEIAFPPLFSYTRYVQTTIFICATLFYSALKSRDTRAFFETSSISYDVTTVIPVWNSWLINAYVTFQKIFRGNTVHRWTSNWTHVFGISSLVVVENPFIKYTTVLLLWRGYHKISLLLLPSSFFKIFLLLLLQPLD